mmetsp:Transcript_75449/g.224924  ORF Transcript_75449/g.224924 Transcript_75449/m.224924 type:complete len:230 (+) Transcript_75449:286-975(+)
MSATLQCMAEVLPPAALEVPRVVRHDEYLGDVALVLLRDLVNDVCHVQARVQTAMRPAAQGWQHQCVNPMCCSPSEDPSEGTDHQVAVPFVGILLLLAEAWACWQTDPDDVHLRRLPEPQGALLRRASQYADTGGVDQAAHVQSVADGRVDVRLHHLKGLEIRGPQEQLVLPEVAVADGHVPGVADACESEYCNMAVRTRADYVGAGIQGAPVRHASDSRAAAASLPRP